MEKYGIGVDNVIMHHHVTGKVCPNPWCLNGNRLKYWEEFKELLSGESEEEIEEEMVETTNIFINGTSRTVNRILKDGKNYICLSDLAGKGFDVSYDSAAKTPGLANTVKEIDVSVDGEKTTLEAVNIGGSNFCKLRDVAAKTGIMEIDYKDSIVIINTK